MAAVLIDNYDSFTHILRQLIEKAAGSNIHIVKNDRIDHALLEKAELIILSPGPGKPQEAGELMQVIEKYHLLKPILGICLGHQALGMFFGAELIQQDQVTHGIGSILSISREVNSPLSKLDEPVCAGRYHSWILKKESFPESLAITAEDEKGQIMAFQHRELPIVGLQFHPESYLSNQGTRIISNFFQGVMAPINGANEGHLLQ